MKMILRRSLAALLALISVLSLFAGCGAAEETDLEKLMEEVYIDEVAIEDMAATILEDEAVPLAAAPAVSKVLTPVASGTKTESNNKAVLDYSNTSDGYVMVKFTEATSRRLKAQVKGPSSVTYTYDVKPQVWVVFPLSDGNGTYKVSVFENASGNSYATVFSKSISVTLKNEFAPFLLPNQYVDYNKDSKVVQKADELLKGKAQLLDKVGAVYDYVVKNFTYDKQKAATVKSGYLPDVDAILSSKKGICFDYAAVMAAMLRSQGIPTKLVVGYSGKVYHAWVNVYSETGGWMNGVIFFDGKKWKLMDPTFASTGKQSQAIMKYIGDGNNYQEKYIY